MIMGVLFIFLCVNLLGVFSQYTCPAGFDCVSQQICNNQPLECAPGLYCPGGSKVAATSCARGEFCSTPQTQEECPLNHFCPTFTVEPLDCLPGSMCGGGSKKDSWFLMIILALALLAVAGAVWFYRSKTRVPKSEKDNKAAVSVKVTHNVGKIPKFNLSISNVGVSISAKKGKRELLAGATGEFHSGRLVAIMGPSGAGKTTLLNVISGRIKPTSGSTYINGVRGDVSNYGKLVGFVPQEDVMIRILTVRQILEHSAKVRLPASMTWAEKVKVVDEVISTLGLSHIQNSSIGDDVNRGISGGERKRVNIGIELVAKPSILFLDEPTTGLDSSSATDVVSCLHDIARTGITVVAVLHQPRFEILSLCDDLLLLGKGGKTAFMGPISDALPYFKAVGYTCPAHINPADFFIDITSGRLPIDPNCPPDYLPPPLVISPSSHEIGRLKGRGGRARSNSTHTTSPSSLSSSSSSPALEPYRGRSISGIDRAPTSGLANSSSIQIDPPRGRSISGIERSGATTLASALSLSSSSLSNSTSNLLDPYRGRSISGHENRSRSGSVHSDSSGRESPPLLGALRGRMRSDSHEFDPSELINQWGPRARAMSESIEHTSNHSSASAAELQEELKKVVGGSTGFFVQFWLFFHRSLLQQVQDVRQFLTELVYQVLPGLALGYATYFELYTPPIPGMLVGLCPAVVRHKCEEDPVGRFTDQIIFYVTMIASAAAAATATSRFGQEKANFKRERRAGINVYAYFLAKNAYDLIDVVRCVLLFLGTFFLLGGAVGKFGDWFIVMFMMMFAAYGMGYLLSIITTPNKALVASVVCCIMWSVTSGLSPTLAQVEDYSVLQIFWWLSYVRWGAEGLMIALASDYPLFKERIAFSFSSLGYDINNFGLDIGMLVIIGLLWRIASFIGLFGVRRILKKVAPQKWTQKSVTIKAI